MKSSTTRGTIFGSTTTSSGGVQLFQRELFSDYSYEQLLSVFVSFPQSRRAHEPDVVVSSCILLMAFYIFLALSSMCVMALLAMLCA